MSRDAPWMPIRPDEWMNSERVSLMNIEAEWALFRLILRVWKDGSVPACPSECAKLLGKRVKIKSVEVALRAFIDSPNEPNRKTHARTFEERAASLEKIEKNRRNGHKGGRPSKSDESSKDENRTVNHSVNQNETDREPNSKAIEILDIRNEKEIIISETSSPHPNASADASAPGMSDANSSDLFPEVGTIAPTSTQKPGHGEAAGQGDAIHGRAKPSEICPYKEIAKLWNEVMADTSRPKVVGLTAGREATMRGLWAFLEGDRAERIESCRSIFERVRASDFCMSGNFATFDWVIAPANRMKILEGNFDNRAKPAPQKHFRK